MRRCLAVFLPLLMLSGCARLSDTAIYYTPVAGPVYPPLEKNAPVPVLSEPPSWPHRVIGRFATVSDRGYPFLYRALLYNARRAGADAVVLRKLAFDTQQHYNYIPAHWENIPQTNVFYQTVKNAQGQWVTVPQVYTTFVPVFRPEQTVVTDVQWTEVTAEMVVRKGKATLALAPADTR